MRDFFRKFWQLKTTEVEERRREMRAELTSGDAIIEVRKHPLHNWSPSGYCIGPCALEPSIGTRFSVEFHVPLPDQMLIFTCQVVVVRLVQEQSLFAGRFMAMDDATRNIVDAHFDVLTKESFVKGVEQDIRGILPQR